MKFTLTALVICFTSLGAIAQTYRWVDEQGQVHYSSMPPASESIGNEKPKVEDTAPKTTAEIAARAIAAERAKEAAANSTEELTKEGKTVTDDNAKKEINDKKQAAYDRKAKAEAQQRQQQISAACDSMRRDLATFQNQPRARVQVDGVVRRLTAEELSAKITELKKSISDNCQAD